MRYLIATLGIGIASLLAALLLDATGWIRTAEIATAQMFGAWTPGLKATPILTVYVIALVAAVWIAWSTVNIVRGPAKIAVGVISLILIFTGSAALSLYGVYISPYQALVAGVVAFAAGMLYSRTNAGSRRKMLGQVIGQRLSARQFEALVDSDLPLELPGKHQEATVVVCQLANHEALIESMAPMDAADITNSYLRIASDYLVESGGYLDRCSGESLRVFFGVPMEMRDHALVASKAVIGLMERIEQLNRECDAKWNHRLHVRIGVDSGPVLAGAFGGARMGGFGIAGPVGEFADRLCSACATYGSRVLMGPDTYRASMEAVESRPIELIRKADGRRIELYEILAAKGGLSPELLRSRDHFWNGVINFRERKWEASLEEFSRARIRGISDHVLDYYVLRSERARRGEVAESEPIPVLALGK